MNWLDIVIIVLLVAGIFGGVKNGLIKSVLSLAGLIIGITLAGRYYAVLAERLPFIPEEQMANIVAFGIILAAVTLIALLASLLLTWAITSLTLGWLNAVGGAVFGLVAGAISIGATLAVWVKFLGMPGFISESGLAAFLLVHFPLVLVWLPPEFDVVRDFFR